MSGSLPTMLLVVGVLGAGAILFMKRCEMLGICDQAPPMAAPVPAVAEPVPTEEDDPDPVNQTVIINAEGRTEYVPYPVPVPGRPVVVHPHPFPAPKCAHRINRNGATYTLTSMSRMPDFQTMQFPPTFIKEGKCIYQLVRGPSPPIPPEPKPVEISKSCCKCKTTGYDNEVRCTHDNGKTWSTNQRYKYNLQSSLNECVKKCRVVSIPLPWPRKDDPPEPQGPIIGCDNAYCKRFPSRCPHCTQANYGALALYSKRMSF